MVIVTGNQIIIVAANDLTAALLAKHDNSLLPPYGTDTRIHLLDLAATFYKLLLPEKEVIDDIPMTNAEPTKKEPYLTHPAALPICH